MRINITAKNFDLTQAIKDIIIDKVGRLEKCFSKEVEAKVVLESNRYGKKIEVLLSTQGKFLKSECIEEDLYVAIDLVMDKLKTQIERFSDKLNKFDFDSIRQVNDRYDYKDEKKVGKIVKRKQFDLKPMMEEEAILQMELLNHNTFMFFNAEIEAVCLLYKRKDGNYGIIESEY